MESVEARFLGDIERRPDDDASRVVYADWLEEQGRAVEAEFIRLQLAIKAITDADDTRLATLGAKIRELAKSPELGAEFRRAVSRPAIENCAVADDEKRFFLEPARFAFVCPKAWDAMSPTAEAGVRFCGACEKRVHYAANVAEARLLVGRSECIAVDVSTPRWPGDLDPPPMMLAGAPMPPSAPTK